MDGRAVRWMLGLCTAILTAAALAVFTDLAASPNPFRVAALEELAKYYEHTERNYGMALEFTRAALRLRENPELRKREARLIKRLPAGRLL